MVAAIVVVSAIVVVTVVVIGEVVVVLVGSSPLTWSDPSYLFCGNALGSVLGVPVSCSTVLHPM